MKSLFSFDSTKKTLLLLAILVSDCLIHLLGDYKSKWYVIWCQYINFACPKSGIFIYGCFWLIFIHRFLCFDTVLILVRWCWIFFHIFSSLGAMKSSSDSVGMYPLLKAVWWPFCVVFRALLVLGSLSHRHLPHISFYSIYVKSSVLFGSIIKHAWLMNTIVFLILLNILYEMKSKWPLFKITQLWKKVCRMIRNKKIHLFKPEHSPGFFSRLIIISCNG